MEGWLILLGLFAVAGLLWVLSRPSDATKRKSR
jgi:hypothetical protein